jgi:putative hydrolase of the HAD superfamily
MTPPLPPSVRAVFFDAVGTLLHPDPPAVAVYHEVGARLGSRLTLAEVKARFAAAFAAEEESDRARGLRTDEDREVARWRGIVAAVLGDVTDADSCFRELYAHFARPQAWRLESEAAETLGGLAARGYVVGVASNFDHRLRGLVAGLPGLSAVGPVVISSEVGWRKPSSRFFEALCRQVRLPAGQVLLVGDDLDNDYLGARSAGLHALLFDPRGRSALPAPERLGRLGELLLR